MSKPIKMQEHISILVNNTCNMTCSHCAGLAMYDFVGTFKWNDHKDRYAKWAEIAEIPELSLCGGEPYLHPELELWFTSIRNLWQDSFIEIMTNGTRLSKRIDLSRDFVQDGNACIVVSCHDVNTADKILLEIDEILRPWQDSITTREIKEIENSQWHSIEYYLDDRIVIKYQLVTYMIPPYHKKVEKGTVYFEMNGDREESHDACDWKTSYTFQHGLLYKCPAVTNYSEAKLQGKYEPEATAILEKYKGCDPFDDIADVSAWVDNITKSIDVCKLCAFDKQTGPQVVPVTLDKNRKKAFRSIGVKQL